jgi:hypothetical protein
MARATRTILEFDKDSVPLFEKLRKVLRGEKGDLTNKEAFMIAVSWGVHFNVRADSIKKSGTGPRLEYLSESDNALLAAAHFAFAKSPEGLLDLNAIHSSAELFAEGGIRLLAEEMSKPGNFPDSFAAAVFEVIAGMGPLPVTEG